MGQTPLVDIPFSVSNGISEINLFAGIDPTATDGIDTALGEQELPPLPPSGVFEVRFVGSNIGIDLGNGSYKDYRFGDIPITDSRTHEIFIQNGSGNNSTISWNLPEDVDGLLQDFFGGIVVNEQISGSGSYVLENPAITNLKLILNYNILTSVNEGETVPSEFKLFQNYPNPFNPATTIQFNLAQQSTVTLKIYDITGKEMLSLFDNMEFGAGYYQFPLNASSWASGTYIYKIEIYAPGRTENFSQTKKMILIK